MYFMVGDDVGIGKGQMSVGGGAFESLRANGTRFPPVHPSAGSGQALRFPSGRTEHGSPQFTLRQAQARPFESLRPGPSRASGRAEPSPPGSPFERLRASGTQPPRFTLREAQGERNPAPPVHPSRGSGRTERGSPRLTLRFPSGRTEHGSRFTLRQAQGRPFGRLRAGLSRGSGQALREPQGER